jgi:hypothetical protein
MPKKLRSKRQIAVWRAFIEISGILFLFYSNLLMGEFNRRSGAGKSLKDALVDIVTKKNFAIGLVTASVGFVVFEFFRKQMEDAAKD